MDQPSPVITNRSIEQQSVYSFNFEQALNPSPPPLNGLVPNQAQPKPEPQNQPQEQIKQQLYSFKGLIGKYSPIGVHIAMILTILGFLYSGCGSYDGEVMVPRGGDFAIQDYFYPATILARPPQGAYMKVDVPNFEIKFNPDGKVNQYYTTLTTYHEDGTHVRTAVVSVNHPYRNEGVSIFQTDWGIAAIGLRVQEPSQLQNQESTPQVQNQQQEQDDPSQVDPRDLPQIGEQLQDSANIDIQNFQDDNNNEADLQGFKPLKLPMADLGGLPGKAGKIWGTFIETQPIKEGQTRPVGASVVMKDIQTAVFYDNNGKFAGVRRPGSGNPIEVSGAKILVDAVIPSTGLQLKYDPGIPLVYLGFGLMIITTFLSYSKHEQIWAFQSGNNVHVCGRTSKATLEFEKNYIRLLDEVPDRSSQYKQLTK